MPHEGATSTLSWVVAGPEEALARLRPLIDARAEVGAVRVLSTAQPIEDHLDDAAAVLLVGGARQVARVALPGVFLRSRAGRRVPAGWLPDAGERLAGYARAAAEVARRANAAKGPFVLLGELDRRALLAAERVGSGIAGAAPVFNWTAERLRREDLVEALRSGVGAAFYFGHAVAQGWLGYGGIGAAEAAAAAGRPLGTILSLCCSTAARHRQGFSFAEELALRGVCAAALGATHRTLHRRNVALGLALAEAIAAGASNLAELLLSPSVPAPALAGYRIIGDPLAPLAGAPQALEEARRVFAPSPDDPLPVIPLAADAVD